ncbi:MAG: hypothetical protein MH204_11740, partial [Fimbriimonadaceae bacterium]|nr:hypothetical protein [Fimbriimonadaceae bacterium]
MKRLGSRLVQKIGPILLRLMILRLKGRSDAQVERLGERFGSLLWKFGGRRRERTLQNLQLAFPDRDSAWYEKTAR